MKISSTGFETTMIIDELNNVEITSVSSGQTLVYDGTNFVNSATTVDMSNYYTQTETNANFLSADTSYYTQTEADNNFLSASTTFSSTLSGLTDVTITSISDTQMLQYNSGTTEWENVNVTTIDVTNPASGETLIYNDGVFINSGVTMSANELTIGDGTNESSLILTSADGTQYKLIVDNSGNLVVSAV